MGAMKLIHISDDFAIVHAFSIESGSALCQMISDGMPTANTVTCKHCIEAMHKIAEGTIAVLDALEKVKK